MTQMYDNTVSKNNKDVNVEICNAPKINNNITSGTWKKCFPNNFKEFEYGKNTVCSFQIIIDLIEKYRNEKFSLNKILFSLKFSPNGRIIALSIINL